MLTLLTPTGCRPEAWAICEKLMMGQTYQGPVRWIIVDDGEVPQPISFKRDGWTLEVIRPKPFWKKGQNTQARNLLAGLEHVVNNERLVCVEDDDNYGAEYLADVDRWLEKADLVGEMKARYFNVQTGIGKQLHNTKHASLCSTAMKGMAIKIFRESCSKNTKLIDLDLWSTYKVRKYLSDTKHVVGIKGLPGRGGIGCGHRMTGGAHSVGLLREWIGDDAAIYGY